MFATGGERAAGTRLQRARERYARLLQGLRDAIVAGDLPVGAALPSEHELAARYGLGRHSVRRALAALAEEGLVETQAGRGSFVTRPAEGCGRRHTLRLAVYYPSAQTAKLGGIIQAFEAQHPLIRIQPLRLHPLGYTQAVAGLIESGHGPDLVVHMNGMLPDLAPQTHLLDLGELMAQRPQLAADLYPLVTRLFQVEGRQYGLPFVFSPIVLGYDRQAFREAGLSLPDPSWTWPDLLDAAQRLTVRVPGEARGDGVERVERYGLYVQVAVNRWLALVLAAGGGLATADGRRSRLGTRASVEALRFAVDLVHRHGVSGHSPEVHGEALFVLRRAAMVLISHYGADLHQFGTAGVDWDVTLVPALSAARRRRHLFQATGVAINRHTPHLRSAVTFLDFLASAAVQEGIATSGVSLPVRASIAERVKGGHTRMHPPHVQAYLQAMEENEHTPPYFVTSAAVAAHQALLLAFAGLEDVEHACRRAAGVVQTHLDGPRAVGAGAALDRGAAGDSAG